MTDTDLILMRITTRLRRNRNATNRMLEYSKKLDALMISLAPYLTMEYRQEFAGVLTGFGNALVDMGETMQLLGQDIEVLVREKLELNEGSTDG